MVKRKYPKKRKSPVVKKTVAKKKKTSRFALPEETRQKVWGVVMFLIAIVISLSFFAKAGIVGKLFIQGFEILIGI